MQRLFPNVPSARGILGNAEIGRRGNEVGRESEACCHGICRSAFGRASVCLAVVAALGVLVGCSSTQEPNPGASQADKPAAVSPAERPPAELVNYTEKIPGPGGRVVTFDMIAVPGGSFLIGSPESEEGRKGDEGPQHRVTVGPFWIGKTEVSWKEYEAFMEAVPQTPKGDPGAPYEVDAITGPTPPYVDPYRGFGGGLRPAVGIGWYGAMVYCKWLTKATGKLYRLPTEAEWEYACRAGSEGKYCFGDDVSALDEYAWHRGNSDHETKPVAMKKPNAWGIYDMHGNVREWCLDWYGADYYKAFPVGEWPKDPKGPDDGSNHIVRGGSWDTDAARLRSASRDRSYDWWLQGDPNEPKSKWWFCAGGNFVGFRVIHPLVGEKPKMPDIQEGRRAL